MASALLREINMFKFLVVAAASCLCFQSVLPVSIAHAIEFDSPIPRPPSDVTLDNCGPLLISDLNTPPGELEYLGRMAWRYQRVHGVDSYRDIQQRLIRLNLEARNMRWATWVRPVEGEILELKFRFEKLVQEAVTSADFSVGLTLWRKAWWLRLEIVARHVLREDRLRAIENSLDIPMTTGPIPFLDTFVRKENGDVDFRIREYDLLLTIFDGSYQAWRALAENPENQALQLKYAYEQVSQLLREYHFVNALSLHLLGKDQAVSRIRARLLPQLNRALRDYVFFKMTSSQLLMDSAVLVSDKGLPGEPIHHLPMNALSPSELVNSLIKSPLPDNQQYLRSLKVFLSREDVTKLGLSFDEKNVRLLPTQELGAEVILSDGYLDALTLPLYGIPTRTVSVGGLLPLLSGRGLLLKVADEGWGRAHVQRFEVIRLPDTLDELRIQFFMSLIYRLSETSPAVARPPPLAPDRNRIFVQGMIDEGNVVFPNRLVQANGSYVLPPRTEGELRFFAAHSNTRDHLEREIHAQGLKTRIQIVPGSGAQNSGGYVIEVYSQKH